MTDSLKFGPEWLRNMSSDNSGSGGGSGSNTSGSGSNTSMGSTPLMPRFQQAEYRYGREEMLSLCEKDMKLPEILPNFKKLFVEKEQLPLALSPSTEDENVYQFPSRPWPLRSPVSLAPPPRIGRGGSVDRGRARPRILSSATFPTRPTFEENVRVSIRGVDRGWPERNGGTDMGAGDWNGSPSSSPRKEFNSHGRGSGMENWRRSRVEDEGGDGWRSSINNSNAASSYRWSRSTSWRDDDSTSSFISNAGGAGGTGITPIARSFSSSGSISHSTTSTGGNLERSNSTLNSNGSAYKGNESHELVNANNSIIGPMRADNCSNNVRDTQNSKPNAMWDQEDIPEWAMENTAEGGGSFDASGAFHVPNDEDEESGSFERRSTQKTSEHITESVHKAMSVNGAKSLGHKDKHDKRLDSEGKATDASGRDSEEAATKSPALQKKSNSQLSISLAEAKQTQAQVETSSSTDAPEGASTSRVQRMDNSPHPQDTTHQQATTCVTQPLSATLSSEIIVPKNTSSDLADRMQEVADDMVEKLIMEDESTSAASPAGSSGQMPLLSAVVTNSPSAVANPLLQRPLQVHNHPLLVPPPQPQPASTSELWYYRDPQNKIQGPFTGTEMAEWYRSDYFDESLFVRRVCDSRFATLGELVKMCGNSMPFLSSHLIPPLQMTTPVIPLNNQPSSIVSSGPTPVNMNQSKPINLVNQMLNTNEMATSLNMHLQYLQKEYLLRQQSLIFSKLSASEQFAILSPERQQQIIQQQMAQVSLPDNIGNLPAFINFLYGGVNASPFSMQQMMPGTSNHAGAPKADLSQIKMPSAHSPFVTSGGRADFPVMPPLHSLIPGATAGQPIVQTPPQPPPPHQPNLNPDDPIKVLLRHIQTTKAMPQNVASAYPPNPMPGLQQMPWLGASSGSTSGPVSMWEFDTITSSMPVGMKPEMKTEQQILEEQRQQQQQHLQQKQQQHQQQPHHPTESQMNDQPKMSSTDMTAQSKAPAHVLIQPKSPTQTHQKVENASFVAQQSTPQPLMQHQQQQQQQSQQLQQQHAQQQSLKSIDDKTTKSGPSADNSSTIKTATKIDETKKPIKITKVEKKDSARCQKASSEEEKKREAAEERKKQKEEKKKQQLEEDRKRQQQLQEEEKRRQMLEEKKRQEEIDRHRRAKMLENAPPKSQKQSSDSLSNRSSVAPWSNPGLPGITTPAASLADIQKAERERRTEERLELLNQRKIQQMEMLTKVEPALTWNAPSINVKSLAEIQAEEHKQQQQIAYEQAVAAVVQRRKKDDLSASQHSFFGITNQTTAPTNTTTQSSSLGSIWSSWNGKPAWSSTSNAGFWEEPAKIPATTGGNASGGTNPASSNKANSISASATGAYSSNRVLSKSQTYSNIPTSSSSSSAASSGKSVQNSSASSGNSSGVAVVGSVSSSEIRNTNNQTGSTGSKTTKGAQSSNKQTKVTSSNTGGSSAASAAASNNKKDDARNEFTSWCIKTLSSMKSTVDVPTFIQFLQDIESPYEVKDYIRTYLGETKECTEFAKQFLERRSKYKNQQRAQNAHIDDMCSPAPAINPASNDFQEVKGKGKKLKKGKMTKLDARILGFSVTAAQDRINVGDRDYGDTA